MHQTLQIHFSCKRSNLHAHSSGWVNFTSFDTFYIPDMRYPARTNHPDTCYDIHPDSRGKKNVRWDIRDSPSSPCSAENRFHSGCKSVAGNSAALAWRTWKNRSSLVSRLPWNRGISWTMRAPVSVVKTAEASTWRASGLSALGWTNVSICCELQNEFKL